MATFLSWLYGVAGRVYAWFGDAFAQLYSGALNAWTWASTQAAAALQNAKSYAFSLYQSFVSDLSGLTNWVSYQLDQLKNSIQSLTSVTYTDVVSWINAQIQSVMPTINAAYSYALGLVNALRNDLTAFARSLINDAINAVLAGFNWITGIRKSITDLVTTLTPSVVTGLVNFFNKQLAQISQFLSDPVTWLMDMLQLDLINAILWLIAIGMGATNSDLPNTPPWRKK